MSRIVLLTLVFLFVSLNELKAQTNEPFTVSALEDARCELNIRYIDMLISEVEKSNERIFVISHAAKNERVGVNRSRLIYTKTVISQFKGLAERKITIATGEKTSDREGKLEFWLGSKLFLVVSISSNQQICLQVLDFDVKNHNL